MYVSCKHMQLDALDERENQSTWNYESHHTAVPATQQQDQQTWRKAKNDTHSALLFLRVSDEGWCDDRRVSLQVHDES